MAGQILRFGYFINNNGVLTGSFINQSWEQYFNVWNAGGFTRINNLGTGAYTATEDCEVSFCRYGANGVNSFADPNYIMNKNFGMLIISATVPTEYIAPDTPVDKELILNPEIIIPQLTQLKEDILEIVDDKVGNNVISVNSDNSFVDEDIYTVGKFYADRNEMRRKYITTTSKTIYLSQLNGNDSNNGLTEATAIATFAKANTLIVNGDTLLIERGSVFTTPTNFDAYEIPADVISASGIKVDCYGDIEKAKPLFLNMLTVPSTSWQAVSGYPNVYKFTKRLGANRVGSTSICYRDWETDRKSTRLNSSHSGESRMPSSA